MIKVDIVQESLSNGSTGSSTGPLIPNEATLSDEPQSPTSKADGDLYELSKSPTPSRGRSLYRSDGRDKRKAGRSERRSSTQFRFERSTRSRSNISSMDRNV